DTSVTGCGVETERQVTFLSKDMGDGHDAGQGGELALEETSPMTERQRLVDAYLREEASLTELARRFGVSRKTAHKWVMRFLVGCELGDRSRRPHSSPKAVAKWLEDAIVDARKQRPHWGPKKLHAVLAKRNPGVELPAVSTFALIFKRNGLIRPRRR